jgi:AAA family ATP:ADP antiporter
VYRGGDAVSGTLFAFLSEGLGLGLALIALIGAGISTLWSAVAIFLGRRYERDDPKPASPRNQPQAQSNSTVNLSI